MNKTLQLVRAEQARRADNKIAEEYYEAQIQAHLVEAFQPLLQIYEDIKDEPARVRGYQVATLPFYHYRSGKGDTSLSFYEHNNGFELSLWARFNEATNSAEYRINSGMVEGAGSRTCSLEWAREALIAYAASKLVTEEFESK